MVQDIRICEEEYYVHELYNELDEVYKIYTSEVYETRLLLW